ncbi:MAG: phospholipase D-like domain-containing protein [Elusimicrobiota bacterium]
MANAMRRLATCLVSVSLASASSAQMRTSLPAAPIGALPIALTPSCAFTAPALPFSPALSVPSASPILLPSAASALSAVSPVDIEQGRSFFDGATALADAPAPASPARAPRGETVTLNDAVLPSRMFSDRTTISGHLIRAIDATNVSIDIAIHGLALREIAAALVRAKTRRVAVRIVMNQTHVFPEKRDGKRSPEVQLLLDQGFEIKILRGDGQFGVMHNKIAIFDGQVLETGSYNWTHAADTWHWENATFHAEQARIKAYQAYWNWMWSISLNIPSKAPAPTTPVAQGQPLLALSPAPQDSERPVRFNGSAFPAQAFSPGGVTAHLVRAIDASMTSIDLANFSFTSIALRDALLRAKGLVKIRIIFDADQYKFLPEMHWFAEHGFDVLLSRGKDGDAGVMHNKFAVFDGALVEAGSFNWTRNGEKNNYENAMFLDAPDDVAAFAAYFERIRGQAWAPEAGDHLGAHAAPDGFNFDR